MKLKFEIYIKKLHYYQKASCGKILIRRFFYFLCCIFSKYGLYNCDFQIIIVPNKFMCNPNPVQIFQILCNTLIKNFFV